MGYACPVCDAEQADAEHLANHLAITASLGRREHQEWLEEHAPDWDEHSPAELGDVVSEHAPEIETPEFESAGSSGHGHGHDHDHSRGRPTGLEGDLARQSRQRGRGSLTAEAESALREAQEMTRQMLADAEDADDADAGDDSDADESSDDAETSSEA